MKIDRLIEKTTEKDGVKKWKVIVGIVVGLVIVFCLSYCYVYWYVDLDEYLSETKDIVSLYEFYDAKVGEDETAVFFIGNSIVGHPVYPPEINRILNEKGYDITTYNLAISSDVALERSLEIQKIIDAKPSLVIYGVSYNNILSKGSRLDERTKLVYSKLDVRNDALALFTNEEITSYLLSPPDLIYLKKYLENAKKYSGKSSTSRTYDYFVDCYGLEWRLYADTQKMSYDEIKNDVSNINHVVGDEDNRYKDALLYSVKTLQDAGIPVVIISMPIHPAYSEKISDESRQNFHNLLDQTGVKWYDMEFLYGDEFFRDYIHSLFETGALVFAPVMADLIIQEMS